MTDRKKIFVLGLSRTGTTSLHAAFVLMGYSSIHYHGNAARYWLAGNFKKDMMADYDVCMDLPTPAYYPQLDERYPGSKFILLERDIEPWLDSVKRQWQTAAKSSQRTLLRDMIRISVYGVTRFNASRLRHVYKTHVSNTKEYFQNRPNDFLTFNVTKGDGWDKLSQFINTPPPAELPSFPRLRTPYIGKLASVKHHELTEKQPQLLSLVKGETDHLYRDVAKPQ